MIEFSRKGKSIRINIDTGFTSTEKHRLADNWWIFENEIVAQAMLMFFQKRYWDEVQAAHEKYYNLGWKEAKAKKSGKRKCFSSILGK